MADENLEKLLRKLAITEKVIRGLIEAGGKSVIEAKLAALEDSVCDIPASRTDLTSYWNDVLLHLWVLYAKDTDGTNSQRSRPTVDNLPSTGPSHGAYSATVPSTPMSFPSSAYYTPPPSEDRQNMSSRSNAQSMYGNINRYQNSRFQRDTQRSTNFGRHGGNHFNVSIFLYKFF